jgi:UDP-GlcNAc:undecaprenyl-phosphate GlcNAc-1-phosphate transferase
MIRELAAAGALAVALLTVLAATPLAIRLANRLAFYDQPGGYKVHGRPTPYLGGAAVMAGIAVGALPFAGVDRRLGAILCGAGLLLAIGTLDDRRTVRPSARILATMGAAALLWASGVSWSLFEHDLANFVLTIVWVVGLVNAFNLMDNMDGAAATIAAVSGGGIAAFALVKDEAAVAALALALVGACVAFLKYNLSSPARIFLGDGGSMPLGFVLAAAVMSLPELRSSGVAVLVPAGLLVGLAIFDTSLVIVSRYRRRVRICLGGRDHLTHRLLPSLRSPRAVVGALGLVQSVLCLVAIATIELGTMGSGLVAVPCAAVAVFAAWMLEGQAGSHQETAPAARISSNGRTESDASADEFLTALEPRPVTGAALHGTMLLSGHRQADEASHS